MLQKNSVNKAIDFVARGLSDRLDAYSLALAASALAAAKHPQASLALNMLDSHANASGRKYSILYHCVSSSAGVRRKIT